MIKYKVKEQNGIDMLDSIMQSRNLTIQECNDILKPSKECVESSLKYRNMSRAVDRYRQAIREGETIATLVDED